MFTNLRIKNFRTFDSFRAEGFGRVNLITGRNGTGKTAFLEALFLNAGATNTSLIMALSAFRGTNQIALGNDSIFRNIFHRLSFAYPVELAAEWRPVGAKTTSSRNLTVAPLTTSQTTFGSSAAQEIVTGLDFSFRGSGTKTSAKVRWADVPTPPNSIPLSGPGDTGVALWSSLPTNRDLTISEPELPLPSGRSPGRRVTQLTFENPRTTALISAIFVLARFYDTVHQIYQQLVESTKRKSISRIISVMQLIDSRVVDIVPLTEGGQPNIYIDVGEKTLLPLSLMGAGFFNTLNIAVSVSAAEDGVVLIDEIEDGIHYLAFPDLTRAVLRLAQENSLQLFITTHSQEIIRSFAQSSVELEFRDISALRFLRNKKDGGRVHVTTFGYDELMSLRDIELELR